MAGTRLLRSIALTSSLMVSIALVGCNDARRTAHASTTVAEAEVSTELPPSQVSDEFLQATATVAAEAASVPHAAVVVPPEPAPPVQDNAGTNQPAPAADNASNAAGNAQ